MNPKEIENAWVELQDRVLNMAVQHEKGIGDDIADFLKQVSSCPTLTGAAKACQEFGERLQGVAKRHQDGLQDAIADFAPQIALLLSSNGKQKRTGSTTGTPVSRPLPVLPQGPRLTAQSSSSTGYKHVYTTRGKRGFRASLALPGKLVLYIGSYMSREDAAHDADYYSLRLLPDCPGGLNFPGHDYTSYQPITTEHVVFTRLAKQGYAPPTKGSMRPVFRSTYSVKSGFRGVQRDPSGEWTVQINRDGGTAYLNGFPTAPEAALEGDYHRKRMFDRRAEWLNFPHHDYTTYKPKFSAQQVEDRLRESRLRRRCKRRGRKK